MKTSRISRKSKRCISRKHSSRKYHKKNSKTNKIMRGGAKTIQELEDLIRSIKPNIS